MINKPIIMLDFETSGLSPDYGDRITEVATIRIVGNEIVDRYVSLVNCKIRIPRFITELTGITQSMVNSAPPADDVIPELLDFIGNDILAAHNASFDNKFLVAESLRLGLTPRNESLVCSLKLARRIYPGLRSYKLMDVSSSLGINFKSRAHRAEADAEVAAKLILHVSKKLCSDYGVASLESGVFAQINKLSAAKVPSFLAKNLVA